MKCSLRFDSPSLPPAASTSPTPSLGWLTQHPQSILAPLVPLGQGGVVDTAGDEGVVVAAAHHQGQFAAHIVCGIICNGLHQIWVTWGKVEVRMWLGEGGRQKRGGQGSEAGTHVLHIEQTKVAKQILMQQDLFHVI